MCVMVGGAMSWMAMLCYGKGGGGGLQGFTNHTFSQEVREWVQVKSHDMGEMIFLLLHNLVQTTNKFYLDPFIIVPSRKLQLSEYLIIRMGSGPK